MSNPTILRKLYDATKDQPTFSINDMRKYGIHNEFKKPNQIGSFFRWMNSHNYTKSAGTTRVTHEAGNKRWIWNWRWTDKARGELGRKSGQRSLTSFTQERVHSE